MHRARHGIVESADRSTHPGQAAGLDRTGGHFVLRVFATLALAVLTTTCANEPAPSPGLWTDVFDIAHLEAGGLGTSAHALADPSNIATQPGELEAFSIAIGGTTSIALHWDATGLSPDQIQCHLDGVSKGTAAASPFTFTGVGKGLHTLSCELLSVGQVTAWARRHVRVLQPCSDPSDCDDALACSDDFCFDDVCEYAAVAGCCLSRFDCVFRGGCQAIQGGGANVCSPCNGGTTLCGRQPDSSTHRRLPPR